MNPFTSLRAYRLYSWINIVGLGLSFCCILFLVMFLHQEWTVDHFHPNAEQIYVLTEQTEQGSWSVSEFYEDGPIPQKPNGELFNLNKNAHVQGYTQINTHASEIVDAQKNKFNALVSDVDTSFFRIFDFPFLWGNKEEIFTIKNNAVVSSEFAKKVWGDKNPLGEQFSVNGKTFLVGGVTAPTPLKSGFQYDIMISTYHLRASSRWMGASFYKIDSPRNLELLRQEMAELVKYEYQPSGKKEKVPYRIQLLPLKELYLSDYNKMNTYLTGDKKSLHLLVLVTVLVFFTGLFNFVNIYSVIILKRGKELGIRKVFGAGNSRMFLDFLKEGFVQTVLSLTVGFLFLEYIRPLAAEYFEMKVQRVWQFDLLLTVALLILFPVILALIPYLKHRATGPVLAIGKVGVLHSGLRIRRMFIIAQYTVTILLIISALFFMRQLHFMLHTDLGINTQQIIQATPPLQNLFPTEETSEQEFDEMMEKQKKDRQYIENELSSNPVFEAWGMGTNLVQGQQSWDLNFKHTESFTPFTTIPCTSGYRELFDLNMIQGRFFLEHENTYSNKAVLSESAAKALNIKNIDGVYIECEKALWKSYENNKYLSNCLYEVVGIIRDFKPAHLTLQTPPVILLASENDPQSGLFVKYPEGKEQACIEALKKIYAASSGAELETTSFQEYIASLYKNEKHTANLYMLCALTAIFISALGLFGLSSFEAEQRRREIAIRKVNGSTTADILKLLLSSYYKYLLISFLIAAPVAWWSIRLYLEQFAHKAPLSWWIFALAALITALISLGTLFRQIWEAANENPADVTKS